MSRTVQLAAFEVLQSRLRRYGRGNLPKRPPYALLLRGLGRCAECRQSLVTHNGYRCRGFDRGGNRVCDRPANGSVSAIDTRVAAQWQKLMVLGDADMIDARRALMRRWSPTPKRLTGWTRIQAELDDLQARLADADAAYYVRGDLDAARHRAVTILLGRRIRRAQAVLADTEQLTDVTPLEDPSFVSAHWEAETCRGRQDLLRLVWSTIFIAKASAPGGVFDPSRIRYIRRSENDQPASGAQRNADLR